MARAIIEIQQSIAEKLQTQFSLSPSAVAEWRLWVNIFALVIHTFELILDRFESDVNERVMKSRPGTREWYRNICALFQNGYELSFDTDNAILHYAVDDPTSRIIALSAVQEQDRVITLRIAKKNESGAVVPLDYPELENFKNYIARVKILGSKITIISTTADLVRYSLQICYDPSYPLEMVTGNVEAAMDRFKLSQDFGGILYPNRFLDYAMNVQGVVTAKLLSFSRKGTSDVDFAQVDVSVRLEAGYFNYDNDNCSVTYVPITE
ncbi:hypothetical protein EZS27_014997 [termite gut metagenome]|uniref:Baseplate protein J-like domain-containing protein n=1 Tax=termite gut metagenome TaxID=433724 RepID=A0A5J4RSI6_9ZZZZ